MSKSSMSVSVLNPEAESALAALVHAFRSARQNTAAANGRRRPPQPTPKPWSTQRFERWLKQSKRERVCRQVDSEFAVIHSIIAAYHRAVQASVSFETAAVIRYRFDQSLARLGLVRRR
jgi:hypothetical protein